MRAKQVLWFVGLWLASVVTIGTIAFAIRLVLV